MSKDGERVGDLQGEEMFLRQRKRREEHRHQNRNIPKSHNDSSVEKEEDQGVARMSDGEKRKSGVCGQY